MTPISRIARLRHPGVLRDFTWAAELPTFGRYNLIYGWNGSGKTTISKLLRAVSQQLLRRGQTCMPPGLMRSFLRSTMKM